MSSRTQVKPEAAPKPSDLLVRQKCEAMIQYGYVALRQFPTFERHVLAAEIRTSMLGRKAYMDFDGLITYGTPAPTIASAATIQPLTPVSFVSGTTTINTITPPAEILGGGQITLIPTGLWATGTSGNIALATTAVVSRALILTYDATTAKWYPSY